MELEDVFKRITHLSDGHPTPAGSLKAFVDSARKVLHDTGATQFLKEHTLTAEHYDFLMDLISAATMIEDLLIDKSQKKDTSDPKATGKKPEAPVIEAMCPKCGGPGIQKGQIQMPGYMINEYACAFCDYNFEKLIRSGDMKKDEASEKIDKCLEQAMAKGKSKEAATKICEAIARTQFGKK